MFAPSPAESYRLFTSQFLSRLRDGRPSLDVPYRPPELEIQSLWFSGAFGRDFLSTCGRKVRIASFGEWNRMAGPDFQRTTVEIEDCFLQGAIELDPEAEDWERHGHATNAAYNEVVLHVFAGGGTRRRFFTRTADHRNVIQVRLDLEAAEDFPHPDRPPARARPGRCSFPLRDMPPDRLESLLQAAARHRMERKARRFLHIARIHGTEEAIHQGVAEALGYHPNQLPMHVLAQRHPLRELLVLPPVKREAVLFGSAGFLGAPAVDAARPATRSYLRGLWEEWWKLRDTESALPGIRWTFTGIRPLNHPHRRLGALAALIERWHDFRSLLPATAPDVHADWPRRVATFLGSLQHPHWSRHYTLGSAPARRPLALFGTERVRDLLGNVLFPVAVNLDPTQWQVYERLEGGRGNDKLERACLRLLGHHPERNVLTRRFYRQQALLQLYEDFCLEDATDCADCPFPEQLEQWTGPEKW